MTATRKPATLLTEAERADALPALETAGWRAVEGRDAIRKIWRFGSFSRAWGFLSRAALQAEALDHHPEWRNVFDLVEVTLTTRDCGGLSARDLALARAMDRFAGAARVEADHGARAASPCGTRGPARPG